MRRLFLCFLTIYSPVACRSASSSTDLTKDEAIIRWSADSNQLQLAGQQVVMNHVSYDKASSELILQTQLRHDGTLDNPNITQSVVSTSEKDTIDSALGSLKFSEVKTSYSQDIRADDTPTEITFYTTNSNVTVTCYSQDPLPDEIRVIYSVANNFFN